MEDACQECGVLGPTQFTAILRAEAGQIIDQATVTFTVELAR